MGKTMYTPTIGELIAELEKFPSESKMWIDFLGKGVATPIRAVDGGSYTLELGDSQWENTVVIKIKK